MRFSYPDLARWTEGELLLPADIHANGLSLDSRDVRPEACFVALRGERQDGHAYLKDALMWASGAIVEKNMDTQKPCIRVKDTRKALHQIGIHTRRLFHHAHVFAVTGSVGKTTTQLFLQNYLARHLPKVFGTKGSQNSTLGVPLTLSRIPQDARYIVLELGINNPTEMDLLGKMSQPHGVLFTPLAPAHQANFSSMEQYVEEKLRLFDYLQPEGWVIFCGDDPYLSQAFHKSPYPTLRYGENHGEIRYHLREDRGYLGQQVTMKTPDASWEVSLPPGHLPLSTLGAVFSVGYRLKLPLGALRDLVAQWVSLEGRGRIFTLKGITFVDETYNASPKAMEKCLLHFKNTPIMGHRWGVLGSMLELGETSREYHVAVGEVAREVLDGLVAVGEEALPMAEAFGKTPVYHVLAVEEAVAILRKHVKSGDWVLCKASRGIGLEKLFSYWEKSHG